MTFSPREYAIDANTVNLSLVYDTTVDPNQCLLHVSSQYALVSGHMNWHDDMRPDDFKKPNKDVEFEIQFTLKGTFSEMLEQLKRIYLKSFCLHLRGKEYEGYDHQLGGLDVPFVVPEHPADLPVRRLQSEKDVDKPLVLTLQSR